MSNLEKLNSAKKQYDELEAIRKNAADMFDNDDYIVCVHFHYDGKIVLSCADKATSSVWAQFDLIDGDFTVINRGNYCDGEIEWMLMFLEEWINN